MSMDDLITFKEASELVPGTRNPGSIWKWAKNGVRGRNGTVVRLRYVRYGRRNFTKREWLEQFAEDQAAAELVESPHREPDHPATTNPAPTAHGIVDHETADRELREAGL